LLNNHYPVYRENCVVSPEYVCRLVLGSGLARVRIVSVKIFPQMQVSLGPEIMPTKILAQIYSTQTKTEIPGIWQTKNITRVLPIKEGD